MSDIELQVTRRPGGRFEVAVVQEQTVVFVDTVTPGSRLSRSRFLDALVKECPGLSDQVRVIDAMLKQVTREQPDDSDEPDTGSTKQADQLIALTNEWRLVHDAQNRTFAILGVNDHREVWPIESDGFKGHLNLAFFRSYKRAPSPQAMTTAIQTLNARARFDGHQVDVHLRVAGSAGAAWIDLCDEKWRSVCIDASGWRVVECPGVQFTRRPGMLPLPEPRPGGDISGFFSLMNIQREEDRRLLLVWLVNATMPCSTYPVLPLTGEQGSGKSTATRACRRLIDPNTMDVRSPPRDTRDIVIAATHGHVLAFENLSTLQDQLCDDLCRMATGAAFGTRKLYTDDAEQQFRVARPVILNGIDELTGRSDLADRSIVLHLPPIEVCHRRTEDEIWAEFEHHHPEWLGCILDLVSACLRLPEPAGTVRERMADYSVIGHKVESTLGWEHGSFADAYRRNRDQASLLALESSAIGPVLLRLAEDGPLVVTVGELLRRLLQQADEHERRHPGWPRSPRSLGNALRRLSPALRIAGIDVTEMGRSGEHGGYRRSIRKRNPGFDVQNAQ